MVQSLKLPWTVGNRRFSLNYRMFCPLTVLEDQKLVYVSKQEISAANHVGNRGLQVVQKITEFRPARKKMAPPEVFKGYLCIVRIR